MCCAAVCLPMKVFMGGKHLPTAAWLVFVAVVDYWRRTGSGRAEMWQFFMDQCLSSLKSTRDFSDIGAHVPLLDAMVHYGTCTETFVRLRKSLTTVGLMCRVLAEKKPDTVMVQRLWLRQSFVKAVAGLVLTAAKRQSGSAGSAGNAGMTKQTFDTKFDECYYEGQFGIVWRGSGHLVPAPVACEQLFPEFTAAVREDLDAACHALGRFELFLMFFLYQWCERRVFKRCVLLVDRHGLSLER